MSANDDLIEVNVKSLKGRKTSLSGKIIDADNFFKHMANLQNKVTTSLISSDREDFLDSIWNTKSYLPIDLLCRVRMGYTSNIKDRLESGINPTMNDLYRICRACDAMGLLSMLGNISTGEPFYPNYGKMNNIRLVLKKYDNTSPSVVENKSVGDIIHRIVNENKLAAGCQPSLPLLSKTKYYALDEFTNSLLTNWYISYLLSSRSVNAVRKLYYPFICSRHGYMLMESKNYVNLTDYKITHVYQTWGLLFQLFSILDQLKHNQLSFQEITETTFVLENSKCSYTYDEVDIVDDITFQMNDFRNVAINVGSNNQNKTDQIRLYRCNSVTDSYYNRISRRVINWSRHYSLANKPGERPYSWITYCIAPPEKYIHDYGLLTPKRPLINTDRDLEAFLHANRIGIPMYQGSFDGYRIILLLCSNEGFYHSLMSNKELNILWRSFWTPLEYEIINKRIQAYHEYGEQKYPYTRMLLGLNLRCNLISHIWTQLKHYAKSKHQSTHEIIVNTDAIIQSPP